MISGLQYIGRLPIATKSTSVDRNRASNDSVIFFSRVALVLYPLLVHIFAAQITPEASLLQSWVTGINGSLWVLLGVYLASIVRYLLRYSKFVFGWPGCIVEVGLPSRWA